MMDEHRGEGQVEKDEEGGNEYIKVELEEEDTVIDIDDDYFQLRGGGLSRGRDGRSDQVRKNGRGRNKEQQCVQGKASQRNLNVREGWSNWMEGLASQIPVDKNEEKRGRDGSLNQLFGNGGGGEGRPKGEGSGAHQSKPGRKPKLMAQRRFQGTDQINIFAPTISKIVEENNNTPKILEDKEVMYCLLCFEEMKEPRENSREEGKLSENLKNVFILRKLLNVPCDEMTNYLQDYGDPSKWIGMCEKCEPLIKEALDVNDKMNKLMKQLDKCRELAVARIQDSIRTEGSELRSRSSRACKNCKNGECSKHMKCLTEKIRTLVSQSDNPLNLATNPFLDGDMEAEAKYQALQVSQVPKAEGRAKTESYINDDDDMDRCKDNSHSETPSPPKKRRKSTLRPTKAQADKYLCEVERVLLLSTKSGLAVSVQTNPLQPRILGRRRQNNSIQIVANFNYNCFQCPHLEPFTDLFSYVGHIIFHYDYPLQCSQCNVYLPQEEIQLENHWKRFHDDNGIQPEKRFHRVRFEAHDAYQCPQCYKKFPFSEDRDTHVETEHKRFVLKKFSCICCNEPFISRNEMVLHRAISHPEIAKFSCFSCDQQFKSTGADGKDTIEELRLRNHIKSAHSFINIPIVKPCPICGNMFDDSVSCHKEMDSHIINCHSHMLKTLFPSKNCNQNFSTAYILQLHQCDGRNSGFKQTITPGRNTPGAIAKAKVKKKFKTQPVKSICTPPTPAPIPPTNLITLPSYSCPTCPKLAPMKCLGFLQHIAFHHERPYKCVGCFSYFQTYDESVEAHWIEFHKENAHAFPKCILVPINIGDVWKCKKCDECFSSDDRRDIHERDIHQFFISNAKKKYNCVTCANQFRSRIEWQFHRALRHPEVAKLSCYYCDERFELKTNEGISLCDSVRRIEHSLKDHTDLALAPLYDPCRFCGHCFEKIHASSLYTSHLQNEHGVEEDNLFPCAVCSFSSKNVADLGDHMKLHISHPNPRSIPISSPCSTEMICDICGWTITLTRKRRIVNFHHHKFKSHKVMPPDEFPVHKCQVEGCSYESLRKHDMVEHAKRHLPMEEREYSCNECGKRFSCSSKLRVHMDTHKYKGTNVKPYQCELCGNSFAVRNYLYIHKRLSHEGRFFPSTNKKKPRNKKSTVANVQPATSTNSASTTSHEQGDNAMEQEREIQIDFLL